MEKMEQPPHDYKPRRASRALPGVLCILLVLITAVGAPAEEPRFTITVPEATDPLEARYNQVVADTLEIAVKQLGFVRSAGSETADLDLRLESAPFPPRLHLSISAVDTASSTVVAGVNGSGRTNVTLLNSLDDLLDQLEPGLLAYREQLAAGENPFLPVAEFRQLRFRREDNRPVEVSVVNGPPLLTLEEEEGESTAFPVSQGEEVELQFVAPYSSSLTRRIRIEDPATPIRVPELPDKERFGVQLNYSLGRMVGAGIGARWYPIVDRGYIGGETDLFFSGATNGAPNRIIHNDYRLLLGFRPGRPENRLRVDISSGFGTLLSLTEQVNTSSYVDIYISVINLAFEARLGRFRPFIRGGVNYVIEEEFSLLETGVRTSFFNPAATTGVRFVW